MAAMKVLNVFQEEMRRAQLSRNSPVGRDMHASQCKLHAVTGASSAFLAAVALSGGSDSTALLWLARQAFANVVGLTVDHR